VNAAMVMRLVAHLSVYVSVCLSGCPVRAQIIESLDREKRHNTRVSTYTRSRMVCLPLFLVSEMTYYMSCGTLSPTHSLTHPAFH